MEDVRRMGKDTAATPWVNTVGWRVRERRP